MFGLGQKRQEKKAKKELEKLEKKEAKVKEKLAKLEEKAKKKEKKGKQEPEKKPTIYSFIVTGTAPFYGHIKYDLTTYNEYYNDSLDDGETAYKYTTNVSKLELHEKGNVIDVVADGYMIGYVPEDKLGEVRMILAKHPYCDKYCTIIGGEYREKDGGRIIKDEEPYCVTVYLRYT